VSQYAILNEELEPEQALVLITHYEQEIPDSVGRVLRLENGCNTQRLHVCGDFYPVLSLRSFRGQRAE
jgi:energy-coupling factor transporter ATP-binding protein EcfA2